MQSVSSSTTRLNTLRSLNSPSRPLCAASFSSNLDLKIASLNNISYINDRLYLSYELFDIKIVFISNIFVTQHSMDIDFRPTFMASNLYSLFLSKPLKFRSEIRIMISRLFRACLVLHSIFASSSVPELEIHTVLLARGSRWGARCTFPSGP